MSRLAAIVGAVFLIIAIRKGADMGLTAVIVGLVIAGMSGHGSEVVMRSFRETVMEPDGFGLLASIGLITMLGSIMKTSGAIGDLMHGINGIVGDTRWVVFLISSIIGLVSVPGGAVFSAPLVDAIGDSSGMSKEQKVVANVMFRRAWYYIYPVSTAMLLTRQLANAPYLAFLLPGSIAATTVIATTARLVFGRQGETSGFVHIDTLDARPGGTQSEGISSEVIASEVMIDLDGDNGSAARLSRLELVLLILTSAVPILVVLVMPLATSISLPIAACLGCLAGVLLAKPGEGYWEEAGRRFREGVLQGIDWRVVGTVAGTTFLGNSISNSLAWELSYRSVAPDTLSLFVFGVMVPAVAGFVIGSHTAAVGVAVPLLLPLISGLSASSGLVVVLFMSSFTGHLLSPANTCFNATVEYLAADGSESWRLLLIPSGMGFLVTLVFWVWQTCVNLV